MSLGIAILTEKSAILSSDGLARCGEIVTNEHFTKHIRLGPNIAVYSGGFIHTTEVLFHDLRNAYSDAVHTGSDPLEAVKLVLSRLSQLPEGESGKNHQGALLAAKLSDGTFYAFSVSQGKPADEYRCGPFDFPVMAWHAPSEEVSKLVGRGLLQAVRFDRKQPPNELVDILRSLHEKASKVHPVPLCNANLDITVLGEEMQITDVVSGAINAKAYWSSDGGNALTTTESVIASVSLDTDGGWVEIYAEGVTDSSTSVGVVLRVRKDSVTGTPLSTSGVLTAEGSWTPIAIDPSPAASNQVYVLTGQVQYGSTRNILNTRMTAANRKR